MRHLDDAQLLCLADGCGTEAEARQWQAHATSCGECSAAVAAIRSQSRLLSGWLDRAAFEADLPEPRTPTVESRPDIAPAQTAQRRPTVAPNGAAWLKAAAIVLLVAAPLAAFPGVRAWIGERLVQVTGEQAENVTQVTPAADNGVVIFAPAPGRFIVRVPAPTAGSALVLRRSDSGSAVLRVDGEAEPVVAAASVRIDGDRPDAVHTLDLPDAVTEVEVRAGTRTIRVSAAEIDAGRTVRLAGA